MNQVVMTASEDIQAFGEVQCKRCESKETVYERFEDDDFKYSWSFECQKCGFTDAGYEF